MASRANDVALLLSGSPYERGLTHGRTQKKEIHEVVAQWKAELTQAYSLPANDMIGRFVERTNFLAAIKTWTPDLFDEIRGIADGCGLDFDTIYAFQCVDELWANGDRITGEHCTSFGFRGSARGSTLLAQTIDVESFRDGYQLVLRIRDEETGGESLVVSCAGVIGFNGLNRFGVGVCCNAELQLRHAPEGLPVACVLRGVLQQPTAAAAVDFLRRVPHATGQHYLVGDPTQVHSMECSPDTIVEYVPEGISDVVGHTNHPLASHDLEPWYRELLDAHKSYPFLDNSRARLAALEARLRMEPTGSRLEQLAEILRSTDDSLHPICCTRDPGTFYAEIGLFTFASTIAVLCDDPELHVTLGPPSRAPSHVLRFGD